TLAPGRLRDPPWGHYDPCARSSLQTRFDRREKRGPEPKNAAMERRKARRPRYGRSSPPFGDGLWPRGGPPGAPDPCTRVSLRSISPQLLSGTMQGNKAPARAPV